MAAIIDFISTKTRLQTANGWAPPPAKSPWGPSTRTPRGAAGGARAEPLFLNIRCVRSGERAGAIQFGFVDKDANVVLSMFGRAPDAAPAVGPDGERDLSAEPLDPEGLRKVLASICRGAALIGFHRVLQGDLMPEGAVEAAASFHCAWRRLQGAATTLGLRPIRDRPMTLNDGLVLAGVPPLESDDAVLRALAIRRLWLWLDEIG